MMIKHGASVMGVKPETVIGIIVANSVYRQHGVNMVMTCGTDSKHSKNSLHYCGLAFDIRINGIPGYKIEKIVHDLTESLGDEFDVVLERNHIHVEYQPEKGINL